MANKRKFKGEGMTYDLSNLQVLCADCNMGKYWSVQLKKEKNIK